jgi:hypothetical protein
LTAALAGNNLEGHSLIMKSRNFALTWGVAMVAMRGRARERV